MIRRIPPVQYANYKEILQQTAKDLTRKNMVPHHTLSHFNLKDPQILNAAIVEYDKQKFKVIRCPACQRFIKGPMTWIHHHFKICAKTHREHRGETITMDFKPHIS